MLNENANVSPVLRLFGHWFWSVWNWKFINFQTQRKKNSYIFGASTTWLCNHHMHFLRYVNCFQLLFVSMCVFGREREPHEMSIFSNNFCPSCTGNHPFRWLISTIIYRMYFNKRVLYSKEEEELEQDNIKAVTMRSRKKNCNTDLLLFMNRANILWQIMATASQKCIKPAKIVLNPILKRPQKDANKKPKKKQPDRRFESL